MKHYFYKKKSRWLLLAILAMMVGASPTWADTLTEDFESLTVDGTTLSNGWFVQGGTLKSTVTSITSSSSWGDNAGNFNYEMVSKGANGTNTSICNYESTNTNKYIIIPVEVTGKIKYYAGGTRTTGTKYVKVYRVTYDSGNSTYSIGAQIGSTAWPNARGSSSAAPNWLANKQEVDLGDDHTMVAFLLQGSAIDEVEYEVYVSTPYVAPASVSVVPSANSAIITWTAGATEEAVTAWNLEYKKSSDDVWSEVHGIAAGTLSQEISGLNDNTNYDVRVKAIYGTEESAWKTTTFKTPRAPITSFPWSEDFTGLTSGNIPDGWDNTEGTTTTASYKWTYYNSGNTASPCLRFNSYNNSSNKTNFLKTPVMSYAQNTPMQLKFWYKNPTGGDFSVYISNDGGANYTKELASGLTGASSWTEKVIDLPTDEYYNNVVIVFKGTSNYGSGDAYIYLDDVLVKENASYAMSISGEDVVSNTIAFGEVKNTSTTKTFTISNDGANTLTGVSVVSSDATVFTVSDTNFDIEAGATKDITVTFVKGEVGEYSETVTISQANIANNVVLTVTGSYATPSVAKMAVMVGEEAIGETVAFGNVGKQTNKTITISNTGEADLVISSISSSNTTDFTVSPASLTVHGNSSETFTVTFLYDENARDEEKTATITVTASNEGIEAKSFTVTGTRIEQWSEDFSGNALPDGWDLSANGAFTFTDGTVLGHYSTSGTLTTPLLKVESSTEELSFNYKRSNAAILIKKQKNGGDWENLVRIPTGSGYETDSEWQTYTITGLEAGNYKFQFTNDDYYLDNFVGFKRNLNDPKMGIYTDAECTVAATTAETKDFGFATASQTATYYIKNDGTGTMTLSKGDNPAGFTATLDKTSVAAGEHATLTITMPAADNAGYHSGNIVVTATDLGTFTITANGVIRDEDKMYLDFSSTNIPATWTTNNWTKNGAGYIENSTYSSGSVETAILTAEAGEEVVIEAKMFTNDYTLGVNYKKQGDAEWSTLIEAANVGTEWTKLRATIADAGQYQLQFVGTRAQIRHIYGLAELNEPVMVVYDNEEVAGSSYNFGNVSNENDATWTLTVKNEGKAKLTGLAAALSGTNSAHYSVEISGATGEGNDEIEANAQATITVKQLKDNIGSHEATLTISADDPIADKVIALSGTTRDHTKLYLDFEDGNFPATWTNAATNTWIINTQQGNKYLRQYSTATSAILTSALTIADDEVLKFDAKSEYSDATLTVRYTTNGGITWTDYATYTYNNGLTGTFDTKTISGIPAGTVMLQFDGMDVGIDNVYGFAPTTAPMLSLTESAVAVANGSTKDFGTLTSEAGTATYTLSNTGTAEMVSTIATTGDVTFEVTAMGEGVTKSENTLTIPAGKTATIVVTMPYAAPFSAKSGAMTITTEGWVGDFTINFTGSTLDPTAFYEDFANNAKPEGWYNSGWTFTSGAAQNGLSAESTFITQKLTVAGTEDMLTYDARAYNISWYTPVLNVSYSTDRKNWTDVAVQPTGLTNDYQTFNVSGLAQGEYYLKFTGSRIYVDNIIGWHKVTGIEHDLYVSTSNIPADTKTPETEINATATVYSLRSAEEGVYAKLFFDEELVATAEDQNISKDGSVNFELTGNVPATEKTYAAKIVVYYSDNSVAFETLTTDVEVAHTRTLNIASFTRTDGDGALDADGNNHISPSFSVTVKNTGSTAATPTVKIYQGGNVVATATAAAAIAAGATSDAIALTATNMSAGEGGELAFTAKAFWTAEDPEAKATSASDVVITVNAAAPKFALYQDETPVNDGDDVEFGLTKTAKTYSYTIKNEGTADLELISIAAPTGFTATAVTDENKNIAADGTLNINVTLAAEQGKVSGDLVITYKVDANTNKTFTLALSGRSISEDTWTVAFDGTQTKIPSDWTNNGGWLIAGEYSNYPGAVYSYGYSASWLMTPRLAAMNSEELTYNVAGSNVSLTVEYSTNKTDWTTYETVTTTGEHSFIAPAEGNYYLRFTGTYAYLTNFVGFKLNIPEHDTEIASSSVPATGKQYNTYTATVTLKENAGKAEEVTAKLYVGGEVKATKNETITANGSTVVTLTWEPQAVISEAVKAYVTVTGIDIDLTTEQVDLTIAKVYTLDETSAEAITEVSEETILLKRTFAAGWNTVCLPFDVAAEDVETLFGEGATIYDLTGYVDGSLNFTKTTSLLGGYPYIVYVKKAIDEPIIVKNVTISNLNTTASYNQFNGAYFRGTYAPMEAGTMTGLWGVTTEAKIAKGNSKASMKGFRAYFELSDGANARLNFFDTDGTTLIKSVEMEKNADGVVYNLNGQRVENMKKGNLYIINGKKQIRR